MIPILDFALVERGDAKTCEALRNAHRRFGACYLDVGEVLSRTHLLALFDVAAAFFSLPNHAKRQVEIAKSTNYRGYVGVGEEFTNGAADLKESFEFAKPLSPPERDDAPAYYVMYGDNQWPPDESVPAFRSSLEHYLTAVEQISRGVMQGLGRSLGLAGAPGGETVGQLEPCLFARAIQYAATDAAPRETPRLEAHTDHVLLAVVAESAPGLEIQSPSGEWILAATRPGVVVILLGELAEFWSGGYFRARPHRVLNGALGRPRISLTSFYLPHLDSVLAPIEAAFVASLRERTPDEPDETSWRARVRDPRFRRPSALDAGGPVRVGDKEWERLNDIFPDRCDAGSATESSSGPARET